MDSVLRLSTIKHPALIEISLSRKTVCGMLLNPDSALHLRKIKRIVIAVNR